VEENYFWDSFNCQYSSVFQHSIQNFISSRKDTIDSHGFQPLFRATNKIHRGTAQTA
jgi:hypothetical protein